MEGLRTFCHLWRHWTSVLWSRNEAILFQFRAPNFMTSSVSLLSSSVFQYLLVFCGFWAAANWLTCYWIVSFCGTCYVEFAYFASPKLPHFVVASSSPTECSRLTSFSSHPRRSNRLLSLWEVWCSIGPYPNFEQAELGSAGLCALTLPDIIFI